VCRVGRVGRAGDVLDRAVAAGDRGGANPPLVVRLSAVPTVY
jgi:hypothetical protein